MKNRTKAYLYLTPLSLTMLAVMGSILVEAFRKNAGALLWGFLTITAVFVSVALTIRGIEILEEEDRKDK